MVIGAFGIRRYWGVGTIEYDISHIKSADAAKRAIGYEISHTIP